MIDLAIERFDLLGFVQAHGALQVQQHEWALHCPACGKQKLIVNLTRKAWHCWVCQRYDITQTPTGPKRRVLAGAGGLLDLVQLLERCGRYEAVQRVLAAGITARELVEIADSPFAPTTTSTAVALPAVAPPEGWRPIDRPLPYLQERGITWADVQRHGIVWCDRGRFQNRLVFPVWDERKLVYWQARAMWQARAGEHFVKALNPPRVPGCAVSSDVLYGLHEARYHSRVVVTEGPVDAIHTGPEAVAAFGKYLSAAQICRLWRAGVRALDLMLDADARSDMEALAPMLASLFDLRMVRLPHGDPGAWLHEDLVRLRKTAAVAVSAPSHLRAI